MRGDKGIAFSSMVMGIIGLLTTCIMIGGAFSFIALILGIVVLARKMPGKGMAITGVILSVISLIIWLVIFIAVATSDSDGGKVKETMATEAATTELETTIIETAPETETETVQETQESEESFKASCVEISYKSLLRNPEDYIGKRMVITAEIKQIMKGGWLDDGEYYRLQTDTSGYENYLDDEYFMYDNRPDNSMKILKEDVLKIYAEFAGLEEVKRALTGVEEEIPAIKAYYVELISE